MAILKEIVDVSYNVVNWEQAKEFYSKTLELPVFFGADEFGWFEYGVEGKARLAINRWNGPDPVPPQYGGGTVVFEVDDAFAAVALLRSRGVKCEDPTPIPGMVTYATFYDPEGNRLQMAGPPPKA
jgi:predicted enzyme related to lactoylglutathione lyase